MDGGAATYAYDGDGRRMKKVTSTETTYTFYSPSGNVISEFTTSNALATATTASSSDRAFYHTTDNLGSAVLVMNAAGLVIENNRTLSYGEAWLATDFAAVPERSDYETELANVLLDLSRLAIRQGKTELTLDLQLVVTAIDADRLTPGT
jgi:hypothetical protein